jgi:REP element-mobilizing transposase RayT
MNDHVHLLLQMLDGRSLSQIVGEFKSYTSRVMKKDFKRQTPVWQEEFFDRIVRDEPEFKQKGEYILTNPFRRWTEMKEYKWAAVLE